VIVEISMNMIEISGCIASGKTTLTNALSDRSVTCVHEDHAINPFWQAFYTDPSTCAFETEVTFLLQHYHFSKLAAARSDRMLVLDHSFELDMAYAQIGLEGSRREIFSAIYHEIRDEIGLPRALVFIRCSAEEAIRRIRSRGRPFEDNITVEFLADLQRELGRRAAKIAGTVPVVTSECGTTDFRSDGPWRERLWRQLRHVD